ncbi:MAG: endonuclease/exonuclease/phosphatase family protein [Planctomycetes bacterium]|nr:endonuclease/exonuclease/phosphatase family protein [Planctomycetota bacterium]MCP4772175.1 endonuclease/exonuclease/phosphatase family protein [Planctomycetota bacterium]MCP4861231.1 endonuclease/exonuclease/phosphatase family protein [Planctomycetota bacterium]
MLLLLSGASLFALKQRRQSAVLASFALFNAVLISPAFFGTGSHQVAAGESAPLRLMSINLLSSSNGNDSVRLEIESKNPQIVVFLEVNSWWQSELDGFLSSTYPYSQAQPREDNFGMTIFSKIPWSELQVLDLGGDQVPSMLATFDNDGKPFHMLAVHFFPPMGKNGTRRRDEAFKQLPSAIADLPFETMVVGDLNATPWCYPFRRLLTESKLLDSTTGFGLQPTWPTDLKLMSIPIDHCLHTPGVRIVHREVGADVGSDHWPLLVDFQL